MKNDNEFVVWVKGESLQITENFTARELECKCSLETCRTQRISKEHINLLQSIRDQVGPLKITSAYRCTEHNKTVGGSKTSQHLYGLATDISPLRESLERVRGLCDKVFKGLGYYPSNNFIHVDSRKTSKKARW